MVGPVPCERPVEFMLCLSGRTDQASESQLRPKRHDSGRVEVLGRIVAAEHVLEGLIVGHLGRGETRAIGAIVQARTAPGGKRVDFGAQVIGIRVDG